MSYCRWSTDDYQCDVYCYGDVSGGYTTHVADNRPVLDGTLPPPVPLDEAHMEAWVARQTRVQEWVKHAERRPIGLPHDGAIFTDATAQSAAARLRHLQMAGYNVPQAAIEALLAEAAEEAARDKDGCQGS